jgi:hypothetical protein
MPGVKKLSRSLTARGATENVARAKRKNVTSAPAPSRISELGWTREQAAQVRASLGAFDADWDAPGMEEYDRF